MHITVKYATLFHGSAYEILKKELVEPHVIFGYVLHKKKGEQNIMVPELAIFNIINMTMMPHSPGNSWSFTKPFHTQSLL